MNKNSKLVSVIIPNHEVDLNFFSGCLQSLSNQTLFSNLFEILVVMHNCSEDYSAKAEREVVKILSGKNIRTLYVHDDNASANSPRKWGWQNADAPNLLFLDADDMLLPYALEKMVRNIPVGVQQWMVLGKKSRLEISGEGDSVGFHVLKHRSHKARGDAASLASIALKSGSICNILFPAVMAEKMFNVRELPHEDVCEYVILLAQNPYMVFTDELTYLYRRRPFSTTTAGMTTRHAEGVAQAVVLLADLAETNPKIWVSPTIQLVEGLLETFLTRVINTCTEKEQDEIISIAMHALRELMSPSNRVGTLFLSTCSKALSRRAIASRLSVKTDAATIKPVIHNSRLMDILTMRDVILCFADYHVEQASQLCPENPNALVLDFSGAISNGKRASMDKADFVIRLDKSDLPLKWWELLTAKTVVTYNDTNNESKMALGIRTSLGLKTVSMVEGVLDFMRVLDPNSEALFDSPIPARSTHMTLGTMGYQKRFFHDKNFQVIGFPLLSSLKRNQKDMGFILINLNFSYGVETEMSRDFLEASVDAALMQGRPVQITRHPMDETNVAGYEHLISAGDYRSLIEECHLLISRFSGLIPQAAFIGKRLVYFNSAIADDESPLTIGKYGTTVTELENLELGLRNELGESRNSESETPSFILPNTWDYIDSRKWIAAFWSAVSAHSNLVCLIDQYSFIRNGFSSKLKGTNYKTRLKAQKLSFARKINLEQEKLYKFVIKRPSVHKFAIRLKPLLRKLRLID